MSEQVSYLINNNLESFFGINASSSVIKEEDYNVFLENKENVKAIVILAELNWQGREYKDFHGFEIALELRRKYKLLCPLIIISILGQSYFEKLAENQIKFKILFARGTAFLPIADKMNDKIECAIQHLNQYPLSISVLTDMNEMLLDQKGFVIDKLTHDLRVRKNKIEINYVLDETAKYLNNLQRDAINWNGFKSELRESLNNPYDFNKIKEDLILKCDQELIGERISESTPSEKKHKIIVLEDNPDFGKRIEKNLRVYFEEVVVKEKAEDVIEELDKDNTNAITAIITDWRLYKDYSKKTYWQLQGYEVLNYAAQKHFIALFSLTSLHDRNVNNIRNKLGLEVHLFKKQHLESGGKAQWEMMADIVKQKCDSVIEIISSQPTGSNWINLQPKYILKRNSGWNLYEKGLADEAIKLFNYYMKAINNGSFKDVSSISDSGIFLKNNLKNILIIRRVYVALYCIILKESIYLQEIHPAILLGNGPDTEIKHHAIDVYSILRKDWWDDIAINLDSTLLEKNKWKKFGQRIKNFRSALCIELSELPDKGLLPEEKSWFAKNNIDCSFLFNLSDLD